MNVCVTMVHETQSINMSTVYNSSVEINKFVSVICNNIVSKTINNLIQLQQLINKYVSVMCNNGIQNTIDKLIQLTISVNKCVSVVYNNTILLILLIFLKQK